MNMPPMLAYTIQTSMMPGYGPSLAVGYGRDGTGMRPANPQDDSYWIVIINAKNPKEKVKEWVVPGTQASVVPAGIETYMNNPDYIFAVVTQYLNTLHVPQGPFYEFLAKYGAGRELQKLEQLNTVLSCGSYGHMSYILTSQCGPRGPNQQPASYEIGSYTLASGVIMMMSLMPRPDGTPPYAICDSYTFHH
jgi:hypothetical protein